MMEERWVRGSLESVQRDEMQTFEVRIEEPVLQDAPSPKAMEQVINFVTLSHTPATPIINPRPAAVRLHGEEETDLEGRSILRGLIDGDAKVL